MAFDPLSIIGGGLAGIGSLASIGIGLFQRAKARKLEKATVRPVYKTPSEVFLNQKMAQKEASQGMDGTTYNTELNNINRTASAGLDTLSKQRNGIAGIGNLVAKTNDATLGLSAEDDAIKRANLKAYLDQNQNVADYSDKEFQYNEADKYAEIMNKIAQLRGGGNAGINSGVNGLLGMGLSLANTRQGGSNLKPATSSLKEKQTAISNINKAK